MSALKQTPMRLRLLRNSVKAGVCRLWTAYVTPRGYAQVGKGGHGKGVTYAHRVAWELKHGPIPEGMEIHHKCGNKLCINVRHLELTTRKDHRRKHHSALTCGRGHPFTEANTYVRKDNGSRACRICRAEQMRKYYVRNLH